MKSFITRQNNLLHELGLLHYIVLRLGSCISRSIDIISIIMVFPIAVIIIILRPFIVIRFAEVDISRIGGLYPLDIYSTVRKMSGPLVGVFDIIYFVSDSGIISNKQWVKMWQSTVNIFPFGSLISYIDLLVKKFPGGKCHEISECASVWPIKDNFVKYLLSNSKPNLKFTKKEIKKGQDLLKKLSVQDESEFICFHARCSSYLDNVFPKRNWSYHNYRDSNIHNYLLAAEKLVDRGYYLIRVGAHVTEKINLDNPKIIDYASNGMRSEFQDIYLTANCKFYIGSPSGISIVPELFKRPIVHVNWLHLPNIYTWLNNSLIIFKKLYLREENRFLTFSELIHLDVGLFAHSQEYIDRGVEVIENTSNEILDVVIEMDERLDGKWESTDEDEELQKSFWNLFGPFKIKSPDLRIGAEFLKQNKNLLK